MTFTASVLALPDPGSGVRARPGWRAQLDLAFERRGGATVLAQRRHVGPLVVQRPFYPEGDVCHVYVVHPPGGVVAGDRLHLGVRVNAGAHALLTTPAAGKFYRSQGETAHLVQDFSVDAGALEWLPQESIFYPDTSVLVRTVVHLEAGARFFGWEIGCLGLPAQAAPFACGSLRQGLELWRGGTLSVFERQHVDSAAIAARWGLGSNAAVGTLLASPAGAAELSAARDAAAHFAPDAEPGDSTAPDTTVSCTLVDGVLVCRGLARRADRLRAVFVGLWSRLRPQLLQRESAPPRIWTT